MSTEITSAGARIGGAVRPSARRPRVMIVAHGVHDEGGMERAFAELIRRGDDAYDFVVISSELAPDLAPLVEWRRTRVPRRPAPLRFLLFYGLAGLRLRLARRDADLVHTCGGLVPNKADFASVHFCHEGFRRAVAGQGHDGRPLLRRINTALMARLGLVAEHWSYGGGRTRALGAVSRGVAAELERAYPGARIVITPNGVDLHRFRPDANARAEFRRVRGLDDQDFVAVFVGGDWHHKGVGLLLRALVDAPSVRLWVVGRGDVEGFTAEAMRLGVSDRVDFLGTRRDVERYYQAADAFVLPSRYEAFPLVSLEAAASGLPLLVTKVNGVPELVGDSEGGLILERSAEAFGRALREFGSDRDRRGRMGQAARRRAEAFTWDGSTTAVFDGYRELLPAAYAQEVAA